MNDMDARCVKCKRIIPEADLQGLLFAEEENRRQGRQVLELLCTSCFIELSWDWEHDGPSE